MMFLLTPIILCQMGACYIDLIVAVCWLLSCYLVLRFLRTRGMMYAVLAGLAVGLTAGMKFHALLAMGFLIGMVLWQFRSLGVRLTVTFLGMCFLTGGYWHVVNQVVFGNFLAPLFLVAKKWALVSAYPSDIALVTGFGGELAEKWGQIFVSDKAIASVDGGFGLIFQSFGMIAVIFATALSWRRGQMSRRRDLVLGGTFLLALIFVLSTGPEIFTYIKRTGLIMIPLALLAIGRLWFVWGRRHAYFRWIRLLCVGGILFEVIVPAVAWAPRNDVLAAWQNIVRPLDDSEFRFYHLGHRYETQKLYPAMLIVDRLTNSPGNGASCYYAVADNDLTAPLFGSRLQNRVVFDLPTALRVKPDFLVYTVDLLSRKMTPVSNDFSFTTIEAGGEYVCILATLKERVYVLRQWLLKHHPEMTGRLL
ncbi:MAG: hypothetical protein HQL22_00425 [Candidatus Omnitrophica bacterium]|nr:hypothetical protein [Candidatus Omnitrophota bacterium]